MQTEQVVAKPCQSDTNPVPADERTFSRDELDETNDVESTNTTVTINGRELGRMLANVSLFASKDKTRPVLTCVHVKIDTDAGTIAAEATDAYTLAEETLAADHVRGAVNRSYLLLADECKPIIKSLRGASLPECVVTFHNAVVMEGSTPAASTVAFLIDGRTMTIESYVGDFPNTSQIWPSDDTEWSLADGFIAFDPARLGTFGKLVKPGAKKPPTGTNEGMDFHYNGPMKPFTVSWHDHATFRGLCMPCRRRD
jgi:hypothetical protein